LRCKCSGFVLHDTLVDDLRADLSRYKALVDRLAVLNNHEGDLRYVISPLLEEARALKEQS
jgi:hypothetical protein